MLTGNPPFTGNNRKTVTERVLKENMENILTSRKLSSNKEVSWSSYFQIKINMQYLERSLLPKVQISIHYQVPMFKCYASKQHQQMEPIIIIK